MARKTKNQIVEDGRDRVREGGREEIRRKVLARYAARLDGAGFFRRLLLRLQIRREIEAELEKIAPRGGQYLRD